MRNLAKLNIKLVLIVLLAFLLGWQLGHRDVLLKWENYKPSLSVILKEPPKNIDVDFSLFWDTWNLLSQSYIDKKALDPNKLFYGSIQGMVSAVGDPYTFFLPPEIQKTTKEELNGSFEGVGIQIGFNEGRDSEIKEKRLMVIAPLSGTPAEKAGIKPLDLIMKIDDTDTTGMSLPEAVKLIRGPKGSEVTLTILREGESETRQFSLIRDTIIVKSAELSFKERFGKNIAVIKLSRFGERTKTEWETAVSDVVAKNPAGLILDLRNNPGGYLEGAVFIASEFLDGGDVVLQENNQGERVNFKVNRPGKLTGIPMVVLINKGSASASEIVAGALQDRGRATLAGEKSFGKGTIQEAQDLSGGTGIHITVAKWLTPKGRWVNDTNGLEVDVTIESPSEIESPAEIESSEKVETDQEVLDLQLEKALELFND